MRVQLWSYNYAPEPQGIAPLSSVLAEELTARGHDVLVVAAHPHYPQPSWGGARKPYRERRSGVPVLRLPIWIGRNTARDRLRQELSFAMAQTAASALLPRPDIVVAVTPCFPALGSAMLFSKLRRVPWVMWLQDIVTDGAVTTGLLNESGTAMRLARAFESATYASASRIVVISDAFRSNLVEKGVPGGKITRIFNPASRQPAARRTTTTERPTILVMGNVGHSQGLDRVVKAFEASDELAELGAELVIAGHGVAVPEVQAAISSDRVRMLGVLHGEELEPVLHAATVGLVSQRGDISEFNLPSKLMNYMSYGIPVMASVRPETETARLVQSSGAGWVTDASTPHEFASTAAEILLDETALENAANAAYAFAQDNFRPQALAEQFENVLLDVVRR